MDRVLNKKIDDQQSRQTRHDEEQAQLKAEILSLKAENLKLGQKFSNFKENMLVVAGMKHKLETMEGDVNRLVQVEQKFENEIKPF